MSTRRKNTKKRKKNLVRTKYGQEKIEYARGGLKSIIMAVLVFVILVMCIVFSYFLDGRIGVIIGIIGLVCIYFSLRGVNYGIKGMKERNKKYRICKVGIGMNAALILIFILLFLRGLI